MTAPMAAGVDHPSPHLALLRGDPALGLQGHHMYLPLYFEGLEADFWRLVERSAADTNLQFSAPFGTLGARVVAMPFDDPKKPLARG